MLLTSTDELIIKEVVFKTSASVLISIALFVHVWIFNMYGDQKIQVARNLMTKFSSIVDIRTSLYEFEN